MSDLFLYLAMAVIGYFIARGFQKHKEKFTFSSSLQTITLIFLVLVMGLKMGSNDEVIHNLNAIGLYALIFTLATLGATVTGLFFLRKFFKMDKRAHVIGSKDYHAADAAANDSQPSSQGSNSSQNKMTIIIVITVIIGLAAGYLLVGEIFTNIEDFNNLSSLCIKISLCVMLFMVGFDMGLDGTFVSDIKRVGFKIVLIPITTITFTLMAAALLSLFLPVSLKESLAIGAGLGWYSFAPSVILEQGYVISSAISFMHNISRELIAILITPFIAKKIGFLECVGLSAAASGDVCLPVITRSTRSEFAIYAFVNGMVCSFAVTVLVPFIINL